VILAVSTGDYLALAAGAANTIAISLLAIAIGMPLGLGLALIRWGRVPALDGVVAALVSLLRATPAVTLVLLIYFALPTVGLEVPRFAAGVATLALGTMAYNCEIWRGVLLAFPSDQLDAARAFGMARGLRLRLIVLPQVARAALPALVNEMTLLIKVSPAVAVIGVIEATRAAVRIGAATYRPIPPLVATLVIYLAVIGRFVAVQRMLERRHHSGTLA
jgi:His/Glu/Gln/Arg/opine family amino acid ABC transporter permease subunit